MLGAERLDYTAAQITATLVNLNRKKGKPAIGLEKLLLKWGPEETVGDIRDFGRALAGIDAPEDDDGD